MDINGLEKFLIKENIHYKPTPGGLLVNLGFLIGRVYIKYDKEKNCFNYNDKSRWISQAFIMVMMIFFLISNLEIYSDLQRNLCILVTLGMAGIFTYKETRIKRLKAKVKRFVL